MGYDIWNIEKTYDQRTKEYDTIFANAESCSSTEAKFIWRNYLKEYIKPDSWSAAWYVPRERGFELFRMYVPQFIYVKVESVNYDILSTKVSVLDINENKPHLPFPEKLTNVHLKELFVLKDQEPETRNFDFHRMAECLDQLRIFYDYLLWPWEEEIDKKIFNSWSDFLTERLKLYFDLKTELHENSIKKILNLIENGKNIHAQLEMYRQMDDEMVELPVESIFQLDSKLELIKTKLRRWVSDTARAQMNVILADEKKDSGVRVITPESRLANEVLGVVRQASKLLPKMKHKCSDVSLNEALISYDTRDAILMCAGEHKIVNVRLDFDVHIRGVDDVEQCVIVEQIPHWYLFKTTADNVHIQNITLNLKTSRTGIYVKEGFVHLESVVMKHENSKASNAVIVGKKASLLAEKCQFLNFDVAVIRLPGSSVEFTDCKFVANVDVVENWQLPPSASHMNEKRKLNEEEGGQEELKKAKLETKALKAKRPGFTDDRYNETSYYIENGLRKVYPYYFTFTTFTKGRWVGEKILDVFAREFRAHPVEIYEKCIKCGSLTVNYEKVDVDYRLKHNDLLANTVHRHEVPIAADPITIIHMDEDIVVVNKPASIPVHPCGRYRHNTVVFILAKEYNLKNLRTIHRLDRLTSGILLFGRTTKKARLMELHIRNRQVQKEYVCRVEGKFPSEKVECIEPIEVVSYKIGVCKVSKNGKTCSTTFELLFHDETTNTSVVLCQPHTGRMHQIRVHLQYLGYPVVNDPLYNHTVFGPEKGKGGAFGKSDEELITDLINIHNAEKWLGIDGEIELSVFKSVLKNEYLEYDGRTLCLKECSREASPCDIDEDSVSNSPPPPCEPVTLPASLVVNSSSENRVPETVNTNCKVTVATQTGQETTDLSFNPEKMTYDENCYECKVKYRDPKPKDLVMYLHAWKYRGPGWAYETELPAWAKKNWREPNE